MAAAYDDGSYAYYTASTYAKNIISDELSADNLMLRELADCLLINGNCNLLEKYAAMDVSNEASRTGFDLDVGEGLAPNQASTPNYYVGAYSINQGQPFVRVGSDLFGAYNGNDYGKNSHDAVGMQPKLLQQALRNLLNTFLGKCSMIDSSGNAMSARKCSSSSDCSSVSYCSTSADSSVCSAQKVCVCRRAHWHIALDEALNPSPNNVTGLFDFAQDETGLSPLWTEPFWNDIGVYMYRYTESNPGYIVLAAGVVVVGIVYVVTVLTIVGMKKEKLY